MKLSQLSIRGEWGNNEAHCFGIEGESSVFIKPITRTDHRKLKDSPHRYNSESRESRRKLTDFSERSRATRCCLRSTMKTRQLHDDCWLDALTKTDCSIVDSILYRRQRCSHAARSAHCVRANSKRVMYIILCPPTARQYEASCVISCSLRDTNYVSVFAATTSTAVTATMTTTPTIGTNIRRITAIRRIKLASFA